MTLAILLSFRRPLTSLLNRIQSFTAGKEGVTVDASTAVSIQKTTTVKDTEAAQRLSVVKDVAVSPSVLAREQRIKTDMKGLNLQPNQETVDILVRQLAVTQAIAAAEMIYRTIFGSQIALLRNMNTTPGTVPRQVVEAVYSAAALRFPDLYATYSFQQWLNYLLENGLIETKDQLQFSISVDGKEFLKWLTDRGLRDDKPF